MIRAWPLRRGRSGRGRSGGGFATLLACYGRRSQRGRGRSAGWPAPGLIRDATGLLRATVSEASELDVRISADSRTFGQSWPIGGRWSSQPWEITSPAWQRSWNERQACRCPARCFPVSSTWLHAVALSANSCFALTPRPTTRSPTASPKRHCAARATSCCPARSLSERPARSLGELLGLRAGLRGPPARPRRRD
jgi:hypothetical protein